jgi:plastocyanin
MRFLLLAAAAVAVTAPVSAAPQAAKAEVVLANFSFTPEELHLHAGQNIVIHFVNNGSGGHDFTAAEFFSAATMDAANRAKIGGAKGRVSLGKDQALDVTLIPKAGTYKAHCSHFMHSSLGMTGKIVVD